MATYAIGDIQGCYAQFMALLDLLKFNPPEDTLWLTGDLVNRGPQSLETVRAIRQLGSSARTVLGNHDLHLLGVAYGLRQLHASDTMQDILSAPDCADILYWFRQQALMIHEGPFIMVHAGLLPQWTLEQASSYAREFESALQGDQYRVLMTRMFGSEPHEWTEDLKGYDRLRVIVNVFTRLRFCTPSGQMEFAHKGTPSEAPQGYLPWFDIPNKNWTQYTVIFGHWSTLGLIVRPNLYALDTGCLWGQSLTAVRLDDRQVFSIPCSA
ncbi:MAG: symmetrical bis(5'-nucleosyl)-tetraphosphatase [Proteobacteria bacterium]|nr:symmetrical bis(5'-nucleosyl)-tetraphosphatase [Pseudomonadota bacterium]MDE3208891.1 symmetrical bis(5'-nucleosyl)-tetraphosphatase [Pseudomonadota bacterium]